MYFLSVPVAALSVVAFLSFREPQLHKTEEDTTLREQLAMTYRTLTRVVACCRSSDLPC